VPQSINCTLWLPPPLSALVLCVQAAAVFLWGVTLWLLWPGSTSCTWLQQRPPGLLMLDTCSHKPTQVLLVWSIKRGLGCSWTTSRGDKAWLAPMQVWYPWLRAWVVQSLYCMLPAQRGMGCMAVWRHGLCCRLKRVQHIQYAKLLHHW